MRRLLTIVAALFFSLTTTSTWAQDRAGRCDHSDFVEGALDGGAEAYRVAVPGRSYFRQDGAGCPGAVSCQLKSYVVGKNQVLVSKVEHGWACALYAGRKRNTSGWLKVADLAKAPSLPTKTDWEGTWFAGEDNQITITRDAHGGLHVDTYAILRGAGMGRTGGFTDGALLIDGSRATYSDATDGGEPICVVRFRRVERYLFVVDNERCGGMGVTLSGAYTRP
jgi:hypothetical protein